MKLRSIYERFAILTSYRSDNTESENANLFEQLKNDIEDLGFDYKMISGDWRECQAEVPYKECPPDELLNVSELALLVPDIPRDVAVELMNKYSQDAIIYKAPDSSKPTLITRNVTS